MADRITHPKRTRPFVIQKNREQLVRNNFLHDFSYVAEKPVEIERLRRDAANFQKEVEQVGPLAEADFGFGFNGHQYEFVSRPTAAGVSAAEPFCSSRMMATLALAPMRFAPAATIVRRFARVRMPPDALTPILSPTARRMS